MWNQWTIPDACAILPEVLQVPHTQMERVRVFPAFVQFVFRTRILPVVYK